MENLNWLNLQLFADGGDGGAAGEGAGEASGDASMDAEMARIPERARGAYKKAVEKMKAKAQSQPTNDNPGSAPETPSHIPYADLIKSDEYKEEHQAWMDKTIKERFKKYDGLEEKIGRMRDTLGIVATKYGLDVESENFDDELAKKIAEDDSYYEDYAMSHDMSVEEAKKNLSLERKVKQYEMQEEQRRRQEAEAQTIQKLRANAEKTKAMYPEFNLEAEMQDERFRRLCYATNHDTTAAYVALHGDEIIANRVRVEGEKARQAVANSIALNNRRPMENGLSNQTPTPIDPKPYKGMNAREMKEYALRNMRR